LFLIGLAILSGIGVLIYRKIHKKEE
jgi:hypothetical protein